MFLFICLQKTDNLGQFGTIWDNLYTCTCIYTSLYHACKTIYQKTFQNYISDILYKRTLIMYSGKKKKLLGMEL